MVKQVLDFLKYDKEKYSEEKKKLILDEIVSQRVLFANVGKNSEHMGYKLTDMVLNCTNRGLLCKPEHFELFKHPDFFNCYTYKGGHSEEDSILTGSRNGLSLIMYGESMGLLTRTVQWPYSTMNPGINSVGMRIVIHAPGTFPDIDADGIDIYPGMSTSVSLRMTISKNIDKPYSNCFQGSKSGTKKYKTSINSCRKMCKDRIILNR